MFDVLGLFSRVILGVWVVVLFFCFLSWFEVLGGFTLYLLCCQVWRSFFADDLWPSAVLGPAGSFYLPILCPGGPTLGTNVSWFCQFEHASCERIACRHRRLQSKRQSGRLSSRLETNPLRPDSTSRVRSSREAGA